jgi:hypothetical protein
VNHGKLTLVALALGALALAACNETTAPTTGSSSAAAPQKSAAPLADGDLPVAADYEEEAEQKITASSYKAELEALEKEVQ